MHLSNANLNTKIYMGVVIFLLIAKRGISKIFFV